MMLSSKLPLARRPGDRGCRCRSPGRRPCIIASGITGLTLPGMIELPGLRAGSMISPMPQRGPEPSQRMLLAILNRLDGDRLELAAELRPRPSLAPCASKWFVRRARTGCRFALRDAAIDLVRELGMAR